VLRFPPHHFSDGPQGRVQLYRPDNAALDRDFAISLDASGRQRIAIDELTPGKWYVRIEWHADGEQYYSERELMIGA